MPFYTAKHIISDSAKKISREDLQVIQEAYRSQLINRGSLPYTDYSRFVRSSYVELRKSKAGWIAVFRSFSKGGNPKGWIQLVRLNVRENQSHFGVKRAINGNLLVFCNCPAFKWWGHQYIMTTTKSIIPGFENRIYPKIRNPQLKGKVCKHLYTVLLDLPKDSRKIYKALNPNLKF